MTHEMIYWITRLDPINTAALAGLIAFPILIIATLTFALGLLHEKYWIAGKIALGLSGAFVVFLMLSVFIRVFTPTTKEAAAIYIVPKIANSETMKEVDEAGRELVKFARDYVKETLTNKTKGDNANN